MFQKKVILLYEALGEKAVCNLVTSFASLNHFGDHISHLSD